MVSKMAHFQRAAPAYPCQYLREGAILLIEPNPLDSIFLLEACQHSWRSGAADTNHNLCCTKPKLHCWERHRRSKASTSDAVR